jgi:hypothetical protein
LISRRDIVQAILVMAHGQGRIGSLNFGGIFFQGAPKKKSCKNENADLKKKKVIKEEL